MSQYCTARRVLWLSVASGLLTVSPAVPQVAPRSGPRLEAVAETRLLMEGLAASNFRGLEGHLKTKPADAETWTFVRGQALLIAETGNLLMLRPPRSQGQDAWMGRAAEVRAIATRLARDAAARDYQRCRNDLKDLAAGCNACHQTFRVPTRIVPFAEPPPRSVSARR
jgi:hypothetical protein